jgi:hypothetical protein
MARLRNDREWCLDVSITPTNNNAIEIAYYNPIDQSFESKTVLYGGLNSVEIPYLLKRFAKDLMEEANALIMMQKKKVSKQNKTRR